MELARKIRSESKRILTFISPKFETEINYRYSCGQWINWDKPQDINAWINVLKVTEYYNNPEITMCVDKYKIREWLKKLGEEKLCPTLYGVYNSPDEINWDELPNQVAVKCNHMCGANLIVKNKNKLNINSANAFLAACLKKDYWKEGEVQYKFINKKIIAEEYLGDGENLKTLKFFCFRGVPRVLYLSMYEDKYINYYDMNFNKLPYLLSGHDNYPETIEKPENFEEMVTIAKKLSKNFPFVRVDLYDSFGKIYISEMTFVPTGGYMKIVPKEILIEWAKWMEK